MLEEEFDDLARQRLSVPARAPGGMSRRRFLQLTGAGAGLAAGASALGPMLDQMRAYAAPPIGPTDGVLVLLMLDGGNDGLNMVVPRGVGRYYDLRPHIAIPPGQVLPLDAGAGLHPELTRIKALYDQGKVAVVQGVGYQPPDLSHFTSMGIWMNGWGGGAQPGGPTGWIGRYLDGLPNAASESLYGVVMGSSVPLHMVGAVARASGLPQNISGAFGIDRSHVEDARMFDTISAFGGGPSQLGQWGDLIAKTERNTLDLSQRIQPAYQGALPASDLGQKLVLCARLVNANLGIRVLSTNLGGFDTHSDQPTTQADLMTDLNASVGAFYDTLSPTFRSRVTLVTFSEFGRRPEDNDTSGTDHGTAAPHFVIGDQVNGGLYGAQPSLTNLDPNGNLVNAVDFRQLYATILDQWLKADSREVLGYNFGNLGLFKKAGPATGGGSGGPGVPTRPVRRLRKRLTSA
ncbi:MAG TPA: DUF1501 domain-containing protein [Acidimicrobiia bacterium]|jgi:uncharacterized protein (DUF1501 family)